MDKNNYCVIMAGGIGSRFWPLSKTERPKAVPGYPGNRKNPFAANL